MHNQPVSKLDYGYSYIKAINTCKTVWPTARIPVSYAQIGLKLQPRRKKFILTTKPALVTRITIVAVKLAIQYVGL